VGERGQALPPPSAGAELIDFTIERQRHRRFVGREDVLAQLDAASDANTLQVWDLESHASLLIHRASSAGYMAVTVTATAIIASDATGAIWFLDWPTPNRRDSSLCGDHGHHIPRSSSPDRAPLSPRSPMTHTILFLAANPLGTDRLELDREARAIQAELERSGFRDSFELVTRWAAEPLDLLRELRRLKPTVVHFSGHGASGAGAGHRVAQRAELAPRRDHGGEAGLRDGEPGHGLFFQGAGGRPQLVSTEALEETFGAAGASVRLVVLSACYSDVQARALLPHVGCVVGMSGAIRDDAARTFAIGFYGGLGERESIAAAYRQGCAAISLEGLRDRDRPQLAVRADVDASKLVLAAVAPSAAAAVAAAAGPDPS